MILDNGLNYNQNQNHSNFGNSFVTRAEVQGQLRGCTSNNSTGDLSPSIQMTCFTPRYLASKGKVASELKAEEVKEEEKNFLKDSYPGLMGSPVQVTMRLQILTTMF